VIGNKSRWLGTPGTLWSLPLPALHSGAFQLFRHGPPPGHCSVGFRRVPGSAYAAELFEWVDGTRMPARYSNTLNSSQGYSHWGNWVYNGGYWDQSGWDCSFVDLTFTYSHFLGDPRDPGDWLTLKTALYENQQSARTTPGNAGSFAPYTCSYSIPGICEFSSSLFTCNPPPSPPPPPPRPPSPPSPNFQSCGWQQARLPMLAC
jgi:hypothetical protein